MAKQAAAATVAMREGVHDFEGERGTARVHVARDRTAREIAQAFKPLSSRDLREAA